MLRHFPGLLAWVLHMGYAQFFDLVRQHRVNHHAFSMDSTQFSVQETEFTGQKRLLQTERQMSVVDDHKHTSVKWQQNQKPWSCFDTEYDSSLWLSFVLEQCCLFVSSAKNLLTALLFSVIISAYHNRFECELTEHYSGNCFCVFLFLIFSIAIGAWWKSTTLICSLMKKLFLK